MDHGFLSAFILMLLVLDPLGSLPVFIPIMRAVPAERRRSPCACLPGLLSDRIRRRVGDSVVSALEKLMDDAGQNSYEAVTPIVRGRT